MVGVGNTYIKKDNSHLGQIDVSGNGESGYINYISILDVELTGLDTLNWGKKEGSIKDVIQ